MTEPKLYRRVRYKWHIVALRVVILLPFLPVYHISKFLYEFTLSISDWGDTHLDPRIIDRVPFDELSEREKNKQREFWKRFGRECSE